MQCKDIPDRPILEFLGRLGKWATWFDLRNEDGSFVENTVLQAMPEGVPPKLALAKMRMLIRRRLSRGCTCGCRGDFEITWQGKEWLQKEFNVPNPRRAPDHSAETSATTTAP